MEVETWLFKQKFSSPSLRTMLLLAPAATAEPIRLPLAHVVMAVRTKQHRVRAATVAHIKLPPQLVVTAASNRFRLI
jgi:hypothetical protein